MKLFCSLTSPYARKIRVALREWNLLSRVEEVVVDPWVDPPQLHDSNPLGKVPALLTDDGWTLPDSRLIFDYLLDLQHETNAPNDVIDWDGARRTQLADGIIDAAVAMVIETRKRPVEYQWQDWLDRQQASIVRTLDALEIEAVALQEDEAGRTEISLACGLAYLDARFADIDWRDRHPGLTLWYSTFSRRSAMIETQLPA